MYRTPRVWTGLCQLAATDVSANSTGTALRRVFQHIPTVVMHPTSDSAHLYVYIATARFFSGCHRFLPVDHGLEG